MKRRKGFSGPWGLLRDILTYPVGPVRQVAQHFGIWRLALRQPLTVTDRITNRVFFHSLSFSLTLSLSIYTSISLSFLFFHSFISLNIANKFYLNEPFVGRKEWNKDKKEKDREKKYT